jgi:uncharacterized repeat protein (TIGR03803 family)
MSSAIRNLLTCSAGALFVAIGTASAEIPKTLHAFCSSTDCADGNLPFGNLLRGDDGTIYGTTIQGGVGGSGVAFALIPNGNGFSYQVIHDFCKQTDCTDGANPTTTLIIDGQGNLYGTASAGGLHFNGLAFELKPNADRSNYSFVDLYDFGSLEGRVDGSGPNSGFTYAGADTGLPYDGISPLYGTTLNGGSVDVGVGFQLTHVSGQAQRSETVLHEFCARAACTDGSGPTGLTIDGNGNLYGTAMNGGKNSGGVLFRLNAANNFSENVLYAFCRLTDCADGKNPSGAPARDTKGALFGTTTGNAGVLYRLGANGKQTVLHTFCTISGCSDGFQGGAFVVLAGGGSIYGTTQSGGTGGFAGGTVFEFNSAGLRTLYSFCSLADCSDGAHSNGLILVGKSTLFGLTGNFGPHNGGTVYRLRVQTP